mgnify:CR=1 FL=1
MALIKEMKDDMSYAVTNYHYIFFVNNERDCNYIGVKSYVSADARNEEKDDFQAKVFCVIKTYVNTRNYVQNMTLSQAYDYLKTLPEFEGAVDDDVFDDEITLEEFYNIVTGN